MRYAILLTGLFAVSANAMTRQQAPAPGPSVQIADPDEATDRLAARGERIARDRSYDRGNARSVLDFDRRNDGVSWSGSWR